MRRAIFDAKTRLLMRPERRAYREMIEAERLTTGQSARLTELRSVAMALHAYRRSPFYRDIYTDAGFSEEDVAQPQNFEHLPLLTKDAIRGASEALVAEGFDDKRRLASRTGGSTGIPLLVYNDAKAPTAAFWWRVYSWWGIRPWDDVAFVYRQSRSGIRKLLYDVEWWPTRHILLDARGTTDSAADAFEQRWQQVAPRLAVGYVAGLVGFAEHLRERDRHVSPPRAISVTASMIHPGQRKFLEQEFKAPVYDTYRTAEIPWIAAECEQRTGMHVLSDHRRVEVVDGSGMALERGDEGNVVVTDLSNQVFPLVRYELGDRSRLLDGRCACGRSLYRIGPILGRIADALRTPSGRIVSGGLGGLFNEWPSIVRQFQIHQAADFAVTVRYVAEDPRAEEAASLVVSRLRAFLADEVPVHADHVTAIFTSGGKSRLVVSDVVPAATTSAGRTGEGPQLQQPPGL